MLSTYVSMYIIRMSVHTYVCACALWIDGGLEEAWCCALGESLARDRLDHALLACTLTIPQARGWSRAAQEAAAAVAASSWSSCSTPTDSLARLREGRGYACTAKDGGACRYEPSPGQRKTQRTWSCKHSRQPVGLLDCTDWSTHMKDNCCSCWAVCRPRVDTAEAGFFASCQVRVSVCNASEHCIVVRPFACGMAGGVERDGEVR